MRWPYFLSIIALLGAGLLLFFNILCGASTSSVLGKWYWLEAGTSNIPGANQVTRWTNYASCGVENGRNTNCSGKKAAYPMSPVANFGTTEGVPSQLDSKHGTTYYLSKTGWAFLLIGLLFTLLAILPIVISFCVPSMTILNVGSGIIASCALLFTALSASLLTAGYVKARDAFHNDGQHAKLGKTMLAFVWTSTFLLGLSSLLSGVGCLGNFMGKKRRTRRSDDYETSSHETYGNNYVSEKEASKTKKRGFFGRRNKAEENLDEVAYAGGLGASGATSDLTKGGGTRNGATIDTGYTRTPNTQSRDIATTAVTGTAAGAVIGAGTYAVLGKQKDKSTTDDNVDSTYNPQTGENLNDVAYAAGVGASGVTSNYTDPKKNNPDYSATGSTSAIYGNSGKDADKEAYGTTGYGGTKANPATGESMTDVGYDTGIGSTGASSKTVTGNKTITEDAPAGNSIWATAASALGFGTVGAATGAAVASADHDDKATTEKNGTTDLETAGAYGTTGKEATFGVDYDRHGADVGAGATKIGANEEKVNATKGVFENKSTVMPLTDGGKHANQDPYGNKTIGYDTGVPGNGATTAANRASNNAYGKGVAYNMPVKEGPGSSVKDTYSTTHVPDKNDLTTTTGYEPTTYYKKATDDDFTNDYDNSHDSENMGKGAVGGATAGAVLGYTANKHPKAKSAGDNQSFSTGKAPISDSQGEQDILRDPNTGETLEQVAYAAGLGASGATSEITKSRLLSKSDKPTVGKDTTSASGSGSGVTGAGASSYSSDSKNNIPGTKAPQDAYDATRVNKSNMGYVSSSKRNKGTGESINDVAYVGGLGALGATSSPSTGKGLKNKQGVKQSGGSYGNEANKHGGKFNPDTGETLDDVAYSAGLGASGAGADKDLKAKGAKNTGAYGQVQTKDTSGHHQQGQGKEDPEEIARSAGYGASGATSDYTKSKKAVSGKSTAAVGVGAATGSYMDFKSKDSKDNKSSKNDTNSKFDKSTGNFSSGHPKSSKAGDVTGTQIGSSFPESKGFDGNDVNISPGDNRNPYIDPKGSEREKGAKSSAKPSTTGITDGGISGGGFSNQGPSDITRGKNGSLGVTGSNAVDRDALFPGTGNTSIQTISSKQDEIPGSFEPSSPILHSYNEGNNASGYKTQSSGNVDDNSNPRTNTSFGVGTGDKIDPATGERLDASGHEKGLVDIVMDNVKSII